MEIVKTCPLGHTCEEARNNKIYRCRWYQSYSRVDYQGHPVPGSEYSECCIPMESLHLTDMKKSTLGVQKAVESRMNSLINLVEKPQIRRIADGDAIEERQIGPEERGAQRLSSDH